MDLNLLVDLIFLLVFAPVPSTPPPLPPLKSILKRKRQVIISSDNNNKSDLDNREKELPGDGDYKPGNR
jgi:hypothetical protein